MDRMRRVCSFPRRDLGWLKLRGHRWGGHEVAERTDLMPLKKGPGRTIGPFFSAYRFSTSEKPVKEEEDGGGEGEGEGRRSGYHSVGGGRKRGSPGSARAAEMSLRHVFRAQFEEE